MSKLQQPITDSDTELIVDNSHDPQDGTQSASTATLSTSTRPRISFRQPSLGLVHAHRGFGLGKKSEVPAPQSAPILVLGEISAPHPSNCKHQGPGNSAQSEPESDEQEKERESTIKSSPSISSGHSLDREQHSDSDTPQQPASVEKSSGLEDAAKPVAKVESFSPNSAFTLSPPSIRVSPPTASSGSLGTRAILTTSVRSSKMVFWGIAKTKAPVPAIDQLPTKLPATLSADGLPTDAIPSGSLLASSLSAVDLPNVSVPPLQFEIPALPSVVNDLGAGPNPPHAKKRMRRMLKQKAQPRLAKARKLLLRKKILSVILGKELTAVLEPHLNAVNVLADNGESKPAPVPL